jgi:hypothetical protein
MWYQGEYDICDGRDIPYDIPDDNKVQTPNYFLWYKAYRDMRYPLDLVYAVGYDHTEFFSEKIADLSSDVVLNRVKEEYRDYYWSSCDSHDYRPDHPSIYITERIKSYDFSDNMYLKIEDEHGNDWGNYLHVDYYTFLRSKAIIPTPMFSNRRLDFWMADGHIKPFCYNYSPGDAVTEYLYYSYIETSSICPTSWKNMSYKPILHAFGVGDDPFLVYMGFPAIGDEIIYPSDCIDYYLGGWNFSYVSFHVVPFDPTIVKTDNIFWGVALYEENVSNNSNTNNP